ncbi:hypothetical protein [Streptomyces sp. CdTB01]|uniref:hypothetical protein n=1 Tax=Streptomyces sp. CdTB01 TaxID=1725411 RepID=UPI00073ADFF4|nr:hypothetical protein [Streptomyces sp. CdTB01]ALV30719.1 hypothetical protein AS200_00355 [Streptomyces sp. CdTB01]
MTDLTPPPMPEHLPPVQQQEPKKSRTNLVIIGSAAAVIAAVIGTGVMVVQSRDDSTPAATTKSSAPTTPAAAAAEEADPAPTYTDLDADSFSIDLKTKSRQCFGSAGCNVTVEPDLTLLVDAEEVDPDATYEITYKIRGDESGPIIETAELSDQTSLNYTPSVISTASSGTKVTVEITDVARQGV